jgi:ABC-type multidrug transport system fused ATPase/permease subunit|tara:strand:+ start:865 stop:2547 length:1683 start_codon:yes stop_codon:yes gene_type:complete
MFFAMILESLSVGIILPLTSILLKGNMDISFLPNFFESQLPTGKKLIYLGLLITILVFLIKNLLLVFNLWQQTKFLRNMHFEITNKLFKYYLKSEYLFFLQNNSAHLYRNLTDIISAFVSYTKAYMIFFTEIIVFMGIAFILFYIDFLGTTLILFSVGIVSFLIYILTIGKISFFGKQRNIVGGELNKHLLQGMASAKDVKILDRENDLIEQVDKNVFKMTRLNQIMQFITGLPRFSFEVLMILAFSLLIFVMIKTNREMIDIIQYLGVFAVASFRIVPGASRLLNSFQSIKYIEPSVKILLEEFEPKNFSNLNKKNEENKSTLPLKFQKEINIKNLSFSYPSRKEFSLSKLSMSIKKGDFVGIIGETGSGKSTLINLIIGLLKPSQGEVEVDQLNIDSNLSGWYKKIGYVPQSIYLTDDTIRRNIAFGLNENDIDDSLIKESIVKANLEEFIKNLPNGLDTIVGEKGIRLSGGQQQRIGIARALYRDPEILILDEATSSLDQLTEKKIMESIQFLKRKKTLIIVTHRLSTVQNCDRILFIEKGKIIKQGSPNEILNSNN